MPLSNFLESPKLSNVVREAEHSDFTGHLSMTGAERLWSSGTPLKCRV